MHYERAPRIKSSRLACLVERNQEPNSHNSDRDENVCKVITKFDSPRKPPAPSDLHQDIEDSQESKKYSKVFGIPLKAKENPGYPRTRQRCARLRRYTQSGCDLSQFLNDC
jgi:hypothetical protein